MTQIPRTGRARIQIPFNRPHLTGREAELVNDAHSRGQLAGDGHYTQRCQEWLRLSTQAHSAHLTHSGTAALEMAALLLDLAPGDEVIMPSYTFVSTASAFALRGAVPVFVDIDPRTLNLDPRLIEGAITPRTRAICVVHYGGIPADMDAILRIADSHDLCVVEDAAQAILSTYKGRPVGTLGTLGALSFHETKNLSSGEGGALLCGDATYSGRAEILRQKGTNRARFMRGEVDRYTWVDVGSSFLPGEITAAYLYAQILDAESITRRRLAMWDRYRQWAEPYVASGLVMGPSVPPESQGNGHLFYLLLPSRAHRDTFIAGLGQRGIGAVFHYIPLHSSPAGRRHGRPGSTLDVTDWVSDRIVRMPIWLGLEDYLDDVLAAADSLLGAMEQAS